VNVSFSAPEIVVRVVRILDDLGIPYLIGGSFASSVYGEVRLTRDADLVIDLRKDQIESLAFRLEEEFCVSREAIDEAIDSRRSFNAIHLESAFKIDFFVLGSGPFDREEFRRRVARFVPEMGVALVFKTAEDTVLRKLLWFRAGKETSEQQWKDVLGVLTHSGGTMDDAYLDRWAQELGLIELLGRARRESRGSDTPAT
jgi:hypothetical protein